MQAFGGFHSPELLLSHIIKAPTILAMLPELRVSRAMPSTNPFWDLADVEIPQVFENPSNSHRAQPKQGVSTAIIQHNHQDKWEKLNGVIIDSCSVVSCNDYTTKYE